jgi:hypothetical protein
MQEQFSGNSKPEASAGAETGGAAVLIWRRIWSWLIHFDEDSTIRSRRSPLHHKPDYADAHVALGALHRTAQPEARASYDRALAIDFQNFEALIVLARHSAAKACLLRRTSVFAGL